MNNFMFYANKENRDEMYIFLEKYVTKLTREPENLNGSTDIICLVVKNPFTKKIESDNFISKFQLHSKLKSKISSFRKQRNRKHLLTNAGQ